MATGDPSIRIRPDGWTAIVTIEGFTTGATYDFFLGAGNVPSATGPHIDVTRPSDDPAGATTVTDRVELTSWVRFPAQSVFVAGTYVSGTFQDGETITQAGTGATAIVVGDLSSGPNLYFKVVTGSPNNSGQWSGNTSGALFNPPGSGAATTAISIPTKDEKSTGSNLQFLCALSEYVYSSDTATLTVPSGWVTNSGGGSQASNAVTAGAVTNGSTQAYWPVLGAWAWPGFQRWDGTSKLRVVAFDRHARQGRSVRAVRFTVTDGTNTYNETVYGSVVDSSMPDAVPVVEYVTTGDFTANMTQGAGLTANFQAYGWVGNSSNRLDSSTGTAAPTPLVGPITGVCDKAGTYGRPFAVVDAAAPNDTAGTIVNRTAYASDALAEAACIPYKTIGKALSAIAVYANANLGRNTVAAGEVAVIAGSYNWLGSSNTYGTTPACWAIVRAATGVAPKSVLISGASGNASAGGRICLRNLQITSGTNNTFGDAAMWLDAVDINHTTASPNGVLWNNTGQCVWATHGTVTAWGNLGFRANSTTNMTWPLVRGWNLDNFTRTIHCYTVIGNGKFTNTAPASQLLIDNVNGGNAPAATNIIVAFNKFMGYNDSSGQIGDFGSLAIVPVRGMAMVQNVFEKTGTSGNSLMSVGSGEGVNTNTPFDNVILWNNTWVGERENFAYNSNGAVLKYRRGWSVKNNNFFDWNIKSDDFPTVSGVRTGDWPCLYGVGFSGNLLVKLGNGFDNEFGGLYVNETSNWNNVISFFGYVDPKCAVNNVASAGNGNYGLSTGSIAIRRGIDSYVSHDITGNVRDTSSGAFSFSQTNFKSGATTLFKSGAVTYFRK